MYEDSGNERGTRGANSGSCGEVRGRMQNKVSTREEQVGSKGGLLGKHRGRRRETRGTRREQGKLTRQAAETSGDEGGTRGAN